MISILEKAIGVFLELIGLFFNSSETIIPNQNVVQSGLGSINTILSENK